MAIQHIVVDLETMSTKPTAAIVSIGAVRLNEDFTLAENAYFYERVSLESSMLQGLDVDAGTIRFWMSQEDEAPTGTCVYDAHYDCEKQTCLFCGLPDAR